MFHEFFVLQKSRVHKYHQQYINVKYQHWFRYLIVKNTHDKNNDLVSTLKNDIRNNYNNFTYQELRNRE